MSDIAAYMKNEELTINEVKLSPQELAELIASIKNGTISGKIGKQVMILFSFWTSFTVLFNSNIRFADIV